MNATDHNSSIPPGNTSEMNDDTPSASPSSTTTNGFSGGHSATRRSLEHASASIESAYRRIRQVRRNLLNIMDSVPNSDIRRYWQENNGIGPDHEAINLTGSSADGSNNQQDVDFDVRPEIMTVNMMEERLRQIETRIETGLRIGDSQHSNPGSPVSPLQDNSVSTTNSTFHRLGLISRESQSATPLPRRREMDDPTTSIGRRVAAREASRTSSRATSGGLSSRFDENNAFFASLEREIENFRSVVRHRRSGVTPGTPADNSRFPAFRRGSYVPSLYTGVNSASDYRRRRMYGTSSAHSPSSTPPDERLSLLSNISVQNMPTPVFPTVPRPLIFDEPTSYIAEANFSQPPTNITDDPMVADNEERSYIIRRRYNADGEEHVHPINLEWIDEDPPSWLLPRTIPQGDPASDHGSLRPGGAITRGQSHDHPVMTSNVSEAPQRRRGWARLDLDGDEIPSDEEEEIERIRMEHRLQGQSRSRGPASVLSRNADAPSSLTQARSVPTTMPPDDENNPHPATIPRVRLNGRRPRSLVEPTIPTPPSSKATLRPVIEISAISVFQADPLPMPLKEMVWFPAKRKAEHTAWIPRHAAFAGR